MDTLKPIPNSIWATIQELEKHHLVKEAIEFERLRGKKYIDVSVEYENDGYAIVNFSRHDIWMLQQPDGHWRQCYVGHDPEYAREVLEEKYGLTRILFAHIQAFQRVCPIYI